MIKRTILVVVAIALGAMGSLVCTAGIAKAGTAEVNRLRDEAARREAVMHEERLGAASTAANAAKSVGAGELVYTFAGHTEDVRSVSFSPDGTKILTGSWDGTAKLWNAATGIEIRTLANPADSSVWSAAFSRDGSTAITGAYNTLRFWDVASGQEIRTFAGTMQSVVSLALSPDGALIATGSPTQVATLWDVEAGQQIRTFTGHTDWVDSVAFSPDGAYLLTGSWDGTAKLWGVESGEEIRTFVHDASGSSVQAVAFSIDGTKALTVGVGSKLWDVATGAEIYAFQEGGMAVASSPNGTRVLLAGWGLSANLYDVSTGQILCAFTGHTGLVYSVAFAPDGAQVLTGSGDYTAKLWTIVEGDIEAEVFGTVGDARTDQPLSGANLTLFDFVTGTLLDTAQTQSDGVFDFVVPNASAFLALHVEKTGYANVDLPYFRAPADLRIRMTPLAPSAPSGLIAIPGATEILLRWNASSAPDIAGYRVERAESEGGPYTALTQTVVQQTRYTDAGLAPGHDYWYRIVAVDARGNASQPSDPVTARAGQVTIWTPGVNGAAGERIRIPINVANTAGISPANLRIVLDYSTAPIDPATITVERTAITAGVTLNVDTATPSRIAIETSGGSVFAGEGRIFDVFATLRADAADGTCGTLSFAEAVFQDAASNPIAADSSATAQLCVSGQCKMGDLDGNTIVQMADATVALRIAVRKVVPQGCQPTVGDMNGDTLIDSADAVMIMRIAQDRPLNPGEGETPVRGQTVHVRIPADLTATPGGKVDVPIMIDNAGGLTGCELLVTFPPQLTSLILTSVELGSATQGFSLEYELGNGFVRIALSRDVALAAGKADQSLAVLHFNVPATAPNNVALPIGINEVKLAGQYGDDFIWQNDITASGGAIAVNSLVCGAVVVSVVDDATSLPIQNASVQLSPGPPFPLTQNTEGLYTFACINPGSCRVTVTAPNYADGEANVLVLGGDVSTATIRLGTDENNGGCCGGIVQPSAPSGSMPYVLLAVALSIAAQRPRKPKFTVQCGEW